MSKKENKRSKSVVDEAMLRAFAKGQLDETTENKIVALLEQNPNFKPKLRQFPLIQ